MSQSTSHPQYAAEAAAISLWRDRAGHWALLMLVFLLLWFSALSHYTLSIDDETGALSTTAVNWIRQGRWVMYLMEHYFITQPSVTYFPLMLFGICASLSYLVFARAFGLNPRDPRYYLLFAIYAGFPLYGYVANFLSNILSYGVGMLAVAWMAWLEERKANAASDGKVVGATLQQVLAVAIANGTYQTLMLAAAVVGLLVIARNLMTQNRSALWGLVRGLLLAAAVVGGFLLSDVVVRGLKMLTKFNPTDSYYDIFYQWGALRANPGGVLRESFAQMLGTYVGSPVIYGFKMRTLAVLLVLSGVAVALLLRRARPLSALLGVLALAAAMVVPFVVNVAHSGVVPYRMLTPVVYVIWFIASLAVFSEWRKLRWLAVVVVAVIGLQCMYAIATFQTARAVAASHDRVTAAALYDRMATAVPGFDAQKKYRVLFYGNYGYENIFARSGNNSTLPASFFGWDEGAAPQRPLNYMRVLGYSNLELLQPADRGAYLSQIGSMPAWPAQGSVQAVDDVILVKLGKSGSAADAQALSAQGAGRGGEVLWRAGEGGALKAVNTTLRSAGGVLELAAGNDVQLALSTGKPERLAKCRELVVQADIDAANDDQAQVFFIPAGGSGFDADHQVTLTTKGAKRKSFLLVSPTGFADSLRFDPVVNPQPVKLSAMEVRCATPLP